MKGELKELRHSIPSPLNEQEGCLKYIGMRAICQLSVQV